MKKKVLYGVFLTALACASMGTLQSCKDDLADLKYEVKYDRDAIRAELSKTKAELQGLISKNADDIAALKNSTADLDQKIEDLKAIVATKAALEDAVKRIEALEKAINDPESGINVQLAGLRADLDQLGLDFDAYKSEVNQNFEDVYMTLELNQEIMTQMMNLLNDRLDLVDSDLAEIWESLDTHTDAIANLYEQIFDLKNEIDERIAEVYDELGLMQGDIDALFMANMRQDGLIIELQNDMVQTNERVSDLFNFVKKQVTGILLQSTFNPLFGDFTLPMGIQSNMLFGWHGRNDGKAFQFPEASTENSFDGNTVVYEGITNALGELGISTVEIPNGLIFDNETFGLGMLYTTVNPVNVDFTNTEFSLETSAGNALPFKLTLNASDEELEWGYNRSEEKKTGFYEAKVNMDGLKASEAWEAIEACRIEIDEDVKSAAKEFYQDRTKRNALEVLKALYGAMQTKLPRYALRYDWTSTVDGVEYPNAVLSKYDLAVATAKPLSYAFAEDKHFAPRFRKVGTLTNLIHRLIGDNFKFDFKDKHLNNITLTYTDLTFSLGNQLDDTKITVNLPNIIVKDASGAELTVEYNKTVTVDTDNGLGDFTQALKDAIDEAINGANGEGGLNDQLKKMIKEDMQGQMDELIADVNDMLDEMAGQINGKIQNVIDKLTNNRFMSAANRVIELYNSIVPNLNNILVNPNHYLQPALFYMGARRPHVVSTSVKDPTILTAAGGDTFEVFASSYTAELFAPAYKKFVACTGVYNPDGTVNKARSSYSNDFNQSNKKSFGIMPGGYKRVEINTEDMAEGLVYEITYQGVDYQGKTSTQTFYIMKK